MHMTFYTYDIFLFYVCIIESYRSLFEESESTSSSTYSTPTSSRTNSSKLKSPSAFTQQHLQQQHLQQQQHQQQQQQQQHVHHQRNHSFEKMPLRSKGESASFKEKLKQKLSRSFSSTS